MTARRDESPVSRAAWWGVGAVLAGWAVVYNLMRFGGSTPRQAAWTSLAIGALIGLVAFAAGRFALRRLEASGRVLHRGPVQVPPPGRLTSDQRDAARLASVALAALAAAAVVMGVAMLLDDLAGGGGDGLLTPARGLIAWNLVIGAWIGDEARRLFHGDAEGIDVVTWTCAVTAIIAGIGLSESLVPPGQVVLIVLAGVAGALGGIVTWRLAGAEGPPLAALAAILVAAGALTVPLVT